MSIPINKETIQEFIAYASLVMGVLTSQLNAIHLPPTASLILGIFGILLHPKTSLGPTSSTITTPPPAPTPPSEPPSLL